jgi:hypothetical protein
MAKPKELSLAMLKKLVDAEAVDIPPSHASALANLCRPVNRLEDSSWLDLPTGAGKTTSDRRAAAGWRWRPS